MLQNTYRIVLLIGLLLLTGDLSAQDSFLVDFGPSNDDDGRATVRPDANDLHWNNWRPTEGEKVIATGTRLTDLVDTSGAASAIGLKVTKPFNGPNGIKNGGLKAPHVPEAKLLGSLAVETATEDYFFTTTSAAFKITGLDKTKRYNLKLFGTRDTTIPRTTRYKVEGGNGPVTADLATSGADIGSDGKYDGNDDKVASIEGVLPTDNGEIVVDLKAFKGGFGYIGIMELESVDTK